MRVALLLALCAIAACGPTPIERCLESTRVVCTKLFQCAPNGAPQGGTFDLQFGHDVDGCVARQASYASCFKKEKDDDLCVGSDAGKKFDGKSADACLEKTRALSCSDFTAGRTPPECASVCK